MGGVPAAGFGRVTMLNLQTLQDRARYRSSGDISFLYGRYSVDDSGSMVTYHIEQSVFPNADGTDQKRAVTISGNELRNVAPIGPCTGVMLWKRAE